MKTALITGVTGQDGAYLSQLLLKKGYHVHGVKRRSSSFNTARIDDIYSGNYDGDGVFSLHHGDMTDSLNLFNLLQKIQPDEIYNLAAQSHVKVSFESPEYTANVDALGTLRLLEAVKTLGLTGQTRLYQASTSELFGKVRETPQSETTEFYPRSPYAVSKLFAYWMCVNYREAYGLQVSNGILFNHESPLRGETFVTQKVAIAVAKIATGKQEKLVLGNLNAKRDWGHAREYVEGMWRILQHKKSEDFVLATGRTETVRRFVELAFKVIGKDIEWSGEGTNEVGKDAKSGKVLIQVIPEYFRPTEVDLLVGDATKAIKLLDWRATVSLEDLVTEMVEKALTDARKD